MKKIGAYEPLTLLQTAGSGSARWCIARRGTRRFFLKEFLSPVYPAENANPVLREKQLARCRRFEEKKRRLYSAMSCVIGDTLVPVTDFFRFGLHYYAVSEEIPEPRLTGESAVETLPMEDKREILLSLSLCLQRLHLQGIVHADLKPEHVLLRKGELGYEARLIDLDSGFLADDPPAPGGDTEGDPVYLAPETFLRMQESRQTWVRPSTPLPLGRSCTACGQALCRKRTRPICTRRRWRNSRFEYRTNCRPPMNRPSAGCWTQSQRTALPTASW